jgi:hypothetical protein
MTKAPGIIVLGVPRSGTTLLRRFLAAHPRITCPPETNLLSAASRFLEEHDFAAGMSVGVVPGLHFSGFTEEAVIQRLREFVEGFFSDIAERQGKARWAEKTAADIFHLDQIERLFGTSCQFVCLVRHPLDVVASIKELSDKMGSYLPELHEYVARHLSPLEAFGHAWADANRRLLRFQQVHAGNCLLIRYEDLTREPAERLKDLFRFLGEDADVPSIMEAALKSPGSVGLGDWKTYSATTVSNASVGRGAQLDANLVAKLAETLNPVMTELGYEPLAPPSTVEGAAARRRYELGLLVAGMRGSRNAEPS